MRIYGVILSCLLLWASAGQVSAVAGEPGAAELVRNGQRIDIRQEKYQSLFAELTEQHGFEREALQRLFRGQKINRKVLVLMDKQWEAKPYYEYRTLFITPQVIRTGKEKLKKYKKLLDRVEAAFHVDREVVVAIWGIETRFGSYQGNFPVLQTLITLFDAYPRRASFFREQLLHFLVLCRENGVDPKSVKGSYAGAFGQTQFIPSSFRTFSVSFDGDAKRDVWHSIPDILASIANYLQQFGWTLDSPMYADIGYQLNDHQLVSAKLKGRKGRVPFGLVQDAQSINLSPSPGDGPLSIVALELPPKGTHSFRYVAGYPNFQAVTEWNHSNRYAMAVCELAEELRR